MKVAFCSLYGRIAYDGQIPDRGGPERHHRQNPSGGSGHEVQVI